MRITFRGSLVDLLDTSADRALAHGQTEEGWRALVRVTLLMALIERLDSDAAGWEACGLFPETVPLLMGGGTWRDPAPS